jgi:hypothetical protein
VEVLWVGVWDIWNQRLKMVENPVLLSLWATVHTYMQSFVTDMVDLPWQ